jgi:hypothetical protein
MNFICKRPIIRDFHDLVVPYDEPDREDIDLNHGNYQAILMISYCIWITVYLLIGYTFLHTLEDSLGKIRE